MTYFSAPGVAFNKNIILKIYGLTEEQIYSKKGKGLIPEARFVVWHFEVLYGKKRKEICQEYLISNGTLVHGLKVFNNLNDTDKVFQKRIQSVFAALSPTSTIDHE
jgi:hypothetical protein